MTAPVAAILARNPLYRRLSEEDRHKLAGVSDVRSYAKGTRIFHEGDPPEVLHTIDSGRVMASGCRVSGKTTVSRSATTGSSLGYVRTESDAILKG